MGKKSSALVLLLLLIVPLVIAAGPGRRTNEGKKYRSQRKAQDRSLNQRQERVLGEDKSLSSGNGAHLKAEMLKKMQSSKRVEHAAAAAAVEELNSPPDVDPAIVDVEVMDYAPAKRKPPIHN
ncbi:uncharacterized protein LOC144704135 [Wolffia australiana]